jgi:hypothetical protein
MDKKYVRVPSATLPRTLYQAPVSWAPALSQETEKGDVHVGYVTNRLSFSLFALFAAPLLQAPILPTHFTCIHITQKDGVQRNRVVEWGRSSAVLVPGRRRGVCG